MPDNFDFNGSGSDSSIMEPLEVEIMPKTKLKPMTDKALITRVAVETVALLITSIPLIYLYIVQLGTVEPYKRGFFCDDENLKHPYLDETISVGACAAIWAVLVLVFILVVEGVSSVAMDLPQWSQALKNRGALTTSKIPRVVIETYRILGYFAVGALYCTLTTELAKYKIGRLRPYFLTVCDIDLTDDLCKDANGYTKFVMEYECTGDEKLVREARKSFLSGHSSFSFYCATFIIMYLHARLSSDVKQNMECKTGAKKHWAKLFLRGLKILRPFLQFGSFSFAFYVALTRIKDYRHHPMDVVVGIIVGIVFATMVLMYFADLFNRPRPFQVKYEQVSDDPEDPSPPKASAQGQAGDQSNL